MPLSTPTVRARNSGAIQPRVMTARAITSSAKATSTVIGWASWVPASVTVFQNEVRPDSSCRSMESSVRPTHPCTSVWVSHTPRSNMTPSSAAAATVSRRMMPFMSGLSRSGATDGGFRAAGLETGLQWPVRLVQVVPPRPEASRHGGQPGSPEDPATDDVADVVDTQADAGVADQQDDQDADGDGRTPPCRRHGGQAGEQECAHSDDGT